MSKTKIYISSIVDPKDEDSNFRNSLSPEMKLTYDRLNKQIDQDFIGNRHTSDVYQWKYHECQLITNSIDDPNPIENLPLHHYMADPQIKTLTYKLIKRLRIIARNHLTHTQYYVWFLHINHYSQNEIGLALGVNQTAIQKTLHGNTDYSRGGKKFGGIVKKLKKHALRDSKCLELLDAIAAIKRDSE